MVFKSNIPELIANNINMKIDPESRVFKLQDASTEAVGFVVLPPNGAKPIKIQGDYPKDLFDRDFFTTIERYYIYPDDLAFEDDELTALHYKGRYTRSEEFRRQYIWDNIAFSLMLTLLFIMAIFMVYIALGLHKIIICIIITWMLSLLFLWRTGGGNLE